MDTKSAFFKINMIFLMIALAMGSYAYLARSGTSDRHEAALQAWAKSSSATTPATGAACEPGKSMAATGEGNLDCLIRQANSTYKSIIEDPAISNEQKAIVTK